MIGDNNPLVILAFIAVCLALLRGIAIDGARIENYCQPVEKWVPDEHCKEAGNLTIILMLVALGGCGFIYFLLNLVAG